MEEAKTKTVAEVMTEAIEAGGKDRADVARAAGVAYSVIWQCSLGYYTPGKENAKKIAAVLGLPESFLTLCEKEHEQRKRRGYAKHNKWKRKYRQKYTVYDNRTDLPIITGGTADECAKAMGMTRQSFYSTRSRCVKPRKQKDERWTIYKEEEL